MIHQRSLGFKGKKKKKRGLAYDVGRYGKLIYRPLDGKLDAGIRMA
jgi:hypothetical protein